MDTVLVTGANRGIGLELTRCFMQAGHSVHATCRNPQDAHELQALATTNKLSIHPLEITNAKSVAALSQVLRTDVIDILINNAGIIGGDSQSIDHMDYDAWAEAFAVNTMAPFRLITTFRDNLKRSTRPRAITLSSQMGALSRKSRGSHAYRSSKAAVNKVMQVLSMELEEDDIIVCPVHPGWVRTDMGGSSADISAEESASGLVKLIDGLTMEHSGRFWTWDGSEHAW